MPSRSILYLRTILHLCYKTGWYSNLRSVRICDLLGRAQYGVTDASTTSIEIGDLAVMTTTKTEQSQDGMYSPLPWNGTFDSHHILEGR